MVCVWVCVGQAGLQVGSEFWRLVDKEYQHTHGTFFNQHTGKARCILVDSEPKVVGVVANACKGIFLQDNMVFDQPGRGNNWAFGYYDSRKDSYADTLIDRVMTQVRQEIKYENDDEPHFFIVVHSLAGGTGSGLGSRTVTCLRGKYPEAHIASVCIAPHAGGEVVLQSYNCLLCLSELSRKADFVILLSNAHTLKMLESARKKPMGSKPTNTVSVQEINLYFGKCLAGLFFPVNSGPVDPSLMKTCQLMKYAHAWDHEHSFSASEFVKKMCPSPLGKFIEVRHAPCQFDGRDVIDKKWGDIAAEIAAITPRYIHKNLVKTISSQMIIRGDKTKTFTQEYTTRGVRDKLLKSFVKAEDFNPDICTSLLPTLASLNYQQSITLSTNRDTVLELFMKIIEDANAKFTARAYVHWYHRYGCTDEVFKAAFDTMRSVVSFYQGAAK